MRARVCVWDCLWTSRMLKRGLHPKNQIDKRIAYNICIHVVGIYIIYLCTRGSYLCKREVAIDYSLYTYGGGLNLTSPFPIL